MTTRPDYLHAIQTACDWLSDPNAIILDTETTDLNGYLVQIAAISTTGEELFNVNVRPNARINPLAAAVHGLTEDALQDAPTFREHADAIINLIRGRRVIIYNADFDRMILRNELVRWYDGLWRERGGDTSERYHNVNVRAQAESLLKQSTFCCAMQIYAVYVGEWNAYHGNYRWQRLPGGDHSALGDCRATLQVLQRMASEVQL